MRLPEHAAHAIRRLERAGFEAWAVGGCGATICAVSNRTTGTLLYVPRLRLRCRLRSRTRVYFTTGLRHGTLTVLTDGGPLEITTYRTEGGYSDGRHPDGVRFVTDIREDLARRDFTVGAMAYGTGTQSIATVLGANRPQNGVLRAVGDADTRFQEDALRILRGLRFASKLGFAIGRKPPLPLRRQGYPPGLHCRRGASVRS